jgi:UDP-N-acetylmuramoylalanine--D-glutamate ligase
MPSSPPLRWADLGGARVGLWGLGEEGHASRGRLAAMGVDPVVAEDQPRDPASLKIDEGGLDALHGCEVVIKSPGVSRYRPEVVDLEAAGVAVVGGLGLWLEDVDRDRVICVTGTKGKSTTVSIAGHLLRRLGKECFVGGNIGAPPFAPDAPTGVDVWVIEVSSFQVTDLWSAPPVVAVTSLNPDHLDWHGSVEQYYADKLSLCTKPGAATVLANGADPTLVAQRGQLKQPTWVMPDPDVDWDRGLGLRGAHNHANALLAAACIRALGIDDDLSEAAEGFEPLPSRLRTIGVVDGVEFVDDSLSTNVLPTLAALDVFADRRVALLVGGYDRHIDYAPLAAHISQRTEPLLVLALPDSGARIEAAITESATVEVAACEDINQAVQRGFAWAQADGVVLLSPAAPSFGQFTNYQARADAFAKAMAACVTRPRG